MISNVKLIATAILLHMVLFSEAQEWGSKMMSPDTMIAGQVNVLQVIFTPPTSNQVIALISPSEYIDHNLCEDCYSDSLFAEEVSKVNDTLYSVTFDVPLGYYPTMYMLMIREENGPHIQYSYSMQIVSPPYITVQPEDELVCLGDSAIFYVQPYEPSAIEYRWYHNDQLLEGEIGSFLTVTPEQSADTGQYYCVLSNSFGTDTTDRVRLDLQQYPVDIGMPQGLETFCRGSGNTTYQLPSDPQVTSYNWVLSPASAGILDPNGNSVTVQWDEDYTGSAEIYTETSYESCPGTNSDTLRIVAAGPSQVPEICIVGMDEGTGKYRIVWNKIPDESIVAYNIYRETNQAGVYLKLKTVETGDFSVLVDSSSVPEEVAHFYRLSYVDTCGLESDPSPVHSTIHLSANAGTSGENNLSWSPYNGFAFLTYGIYWGTNRDALQILQEVSSNATSYTDLNPPDGKVFYQIAVSREGACQPGKKSGTDYSITKSNIVELEATGTGQVFSDRSLEIYPNPARNYVEVTFTQDASVKTYISISDLTGKIMVEYQNVNGSATIPLTGLVEGIYLIRLKADGYTIVRKLIIRK